VVQEIEVRIHVQAPIELVFDAMADHEGFIRDRDGTVTKVVRAGQIDRNGLGCLREVRSGWTVRFVEEITDWRRPATYAYEIRQSSIPMRHLGGRMSFTANGGGTDVEWRSRFEIPIPIAGRVVGPIAKAMLEKAFKRFLESAKGKLEASG
jgi:hypothetical protein